LFRSTEQCGPLKTEKPSIDDCKTFRHEQIKFVTHIKNPVTQRSLQCISYNVQLPRDVPPLPGIPPISLQPFQLVSSWSTWIVNS